MQNLPNKYNIPTRAQTLQQRYNSSRIFLYIISTFTVINIISLVLNGSYYFLISSSIPYVLVALGMILCGLVPEEYADDFAALHIFDQTVFVIFLLVALAIIALYVLSAIFSKKKKVGWLIFALVFFCLDTVLMFVYFGFVADIIIDAIFHVFIIISLSVGINAHYQLKKLPPEEQPVENEQQTENSTPNENLSDSPILRSADFSVKSKTFLECDYLNHKIIYRRVKKVNELVIDGYVYAEYSALIEFSHTLCAAVGGHMFYAGLQFNKSFIAVDGITLKQKIRWI